MLDALRLLERVPQAAKVTAALQRAVQGDPAALEYLRQEGWSEVLDVVHPGAGSTGRRILQQVRDAAAEIRQTLDGDVIAAEYEVLEDGQPRGPWDPFVRRLVKQRFGGHVLLGPMGQGKTSLAKKLAWHWRQQHGYQVECVEMFGEDRPAWAVSISMQTLIRRMKQLQKYLDSQAVHDDWEEDEEEDEEYRRLPATLPPSRKVIIIDEAGMAISTSAMDPGRKAALRALTQCRHVDWVVLYLGQTASQIPLPILGQTTTWIKQPTGKEIYTDRDSPLVRDLWTRATAAFAGLRRSPWYVPPFADPRAWAYCDCASLNGIARGYTGLVPFTPAPNVDVDDGDPQEEE